jgi:outer membrane protein
MTGPSRVDRCPPAVDDGQETKTMMIEMGRSVPGMLLKSVVASLTLFLFLPGTLAAQRTGSADVVRAQAEAPANGVVESVAMSLPEAIRLALHQSLDIKDARLALRQAEEQVVEAWGSVMPSIDFTGSYTRNIAPAVSFVPGEFFGGEPGTFVRLQFGADNAWSSAINFTQPLFEAQAFIGVGAAGRFKSLQIETLRGRAQNLVTRVRIGYYGLLLAQEDLRLIENSVGRVRQSLEETQALHRGGLSSEYDVLRLQVELANLEPNLRRAANAVNQARRGLALELNLDEMEGLSVTGSLAEMDPESLEANQGANREILEMVGVENAIFLDPDDLLSMAYEARSDLRQLDLTEKLRTAELRVQQVEYFPKVSLFGNYAINAQQNGSPNWFGDELTRATSKWVGVQVTLPVFTGFKRGARVDRQKAVLNQARNQSQLARLQTESQVKTLHEQSEEALQRARGQKLAVSQAQRGFEIASAQYREGMSSQLELTDAEVALRQSEFNYAQAVFDFLVARAQLDEAAGVVPMVNEVLRETGDLR